MLHTSEVLPDVFEKIENQQLNRGSLFGISTGFYDLDNYTCGLQKGQLIVVAARPSMGKSAFCLNIASHVALKEEKPVLIFSLETATEQVIQRMLCAEAKLDAQKFRTGALTEHDFPKLTQAMGILGEAPIYIDDTSGIPFQDLRSKAQDLKERIGDIGLIIVDYLQLVGTDFESSNRVQEVAQISHGLKNLARELDVPVIAVSQLSRAVESRQDKKPILSDLRDSGSIEQDADLVMFIYRDEYYNKESDRHGQADIIIAKQRHGPVGEVMLLFQHNITKFLNPVDRRTQIF